MVVADPLADVVRVALLARDRLAELRVAAHCLPLGVGQRAGLLHDPLAEHVLADVVQRAGQLEHREGLRIEPQDLADPARVLPDAVLLFAHAFSLRPLVKRYCDARYAGIANAAVTPSDRAMLTSLVPSMPYLIAFTR